MDENGSDLSLGISMLANLRSRRRLSPLLFRVRKTMDRETRSGQNDSFLVCQRGVRPAITYE